MTSNCWIVYHQKATLLENVTRYVRSARSGSILDIGAGTAATAVPLSKLVSQYHAVEMDPARALALRQAGIHVTIGQFPMPIDGRYDFVLSSHSLPERSAADVPAFLSAAWGLVGDRGTLLVVTFKGSLGDLSGIREELLGRPSSRGSDFDAVAAFGPPDAAARTIERVNSYVEAGSSRALAQFLLPWISGVDDVRQVVLPDLEHILLTRYKVREDYFVFPTQHLFLGFQRA